MHIDEGDDYIHGTTPREQERLDTMNRLINQACLRELALEVGTTILDVGCGPGQFSRQMARAVGNRGRVLGVERDPRQIDEGSRLAQETNEENLVEIRRGDATELPLHLNEWATFDLAHTRFLLEHMKDPLAVVREMVKAVRLGGRIVLADDDHDLLRLWPEPPGAMHAWRSYLRTYDRIGCDPYVGRRLVELLHRAGAKPTRITCLNYGACAGHPDFTGLATNLVEVLHGAREIIAALELTDPDYYDAGIDAIRQWATRPDAALWYVIHWAEARRAV